MVSVLERHSGRNEAKNGGYTSGTIPHTYLTGANTPTIQYWREKLKPVCFMET